MSEMKQFVILCLAALSSAALSPEQLRKFPDDFIFGAATAAYQIEGGWNADDKGENVWDYTLHKNPHVVKDFSNGDIADDTYHNYKRDVEMMRELGLDAYRFSLSWSRILPSGFANRVSKAGVQFYNNYINEMVKYNITPIVTLNHWDIPQKLHELGGFVNPLISDWFEDYAKVAFAQFGDRVKMWTTFNEPRQICYEGYGDALKAPMLNATGIAEYICAKNLLISHARACHAYDDHFKPIQGGKCGITISVHLYTAATDSEEDQIAADLTQQFEWGIYVHPIFSERGNFPKGLIRRVEKKSEAQGYPRSRLPKFTEEEIAFIQGSADFLGVNHYTTYLVSANDVPITEPIPSMYNDLGINSNLNLAPEWKKSASEWLRLSPGSMYTVLSQLKNKYNNPVMYVTESGWSTAPGASSLEDDSRIEYYRSSLEDVLDALEEGVNVKGYMAWSLMDNFEWIQGYTERFGLYEVDFESPLRTRTPRKSAFVYKQIVKSRVIDYNYEPETRTMTIDEGH